MAFMIPEVLVNAEQSDIDTFSWLHRSLPEECTIWHGSALELADNERPPFLGMAEVTGIFTIHSLATSGSEFSSANTTLQAPVQQARSRHQALIDLFGDADNRAMVTQDGSLRPAAHCVCILTTLTAREIGQLGLRTLNKEVLLLGKDEVGQLFSILQSQTPSDKRLTAEQFNTVRCLVSPGIEIRLRRHAITSVGGTIQEPQQPLLLDVQQEQVVKSFLDLPETQQGLSRDLDTRLVRGVPGSGKSVILLHRAHFISQRFPSWKTLVLTYTRSLSDFLGARYRDFPERSDNVEIVHFHKWARQELFAHRLWHDPLPDWSRDGDSRNSIIREIMRNPANSSLSLDQDYLTKELDWITESGITSLEDYLKAERRGRKQRLNATQRKMVWQVREAYLTRLRSMGNTDWPEVAATLLKGLNDGTIRDQKYDAILVDEAQDFAPVWFQILLRMLRPTTNMLFMAADTAQKIYERPLSWRALGIDLKGGRSRILKRSYRNTYEILQAANEVILGNADVAQELKAEGDELIQPDLNKLTMRPGPLPILWWTKDQNAQISLIADEIMKLRKEFGWEWGDFAILAKTNNELKTMSAHLEARRMPWQIAKGQDIDLARNDIKLVSLHGSKGLEFSTVFIADLDKLQPTMGHSSEEERVEALAAERRLLYVAMTRARDRLYMMYSGALPDWLQQSLKSIDRRAQ